MRFQKRNLNKNTGVLKIQAQRKNENGEKNLFDFMKFARKLTKIVQEIFKTPVLSTYVQFRF